MLAIFRSTTAMLLIALCVAAFAFVAWGPSGFVGISLGMASATTGLVILFMTIRYLTDNETRRQQAKVGAIWVVALFFVKLPALYGGFIAAEAIGNHAPGCFIGGLLLVYSALVGWALARS